MPTEADLVWQYQHIRVFYRPELDGRGSALAASFVDFVRRACDRTYSSAFEWCAGPAFIGFALLAQGLCDRLVVSDINPAAIACVRRTIAANRLEHRVRCYVGDNIAPLPQTARFDLVVGNPPSYFGLNPRHSRYRMYRDDLRPNDPQWRVHQGFYSAIRPHLMADAVLHISEVDPHCTEVFIPRSETEPYDIRPRPPLHEFREMVERAGLHYEGITPYFTGADGAELYIMTSTNPP
ncbi:MAG: methyltransferase [Solirubrobacterales bacterium]|nr:methyltransferase [Solirubrobacterales bacterium]